MPQETPCDCMLCVGSPQARDAGQCHGYNRRVTGEHDPCLLAATPGDLLCPVHASPQSDAVRASCRNLAPRSPTGRPRWVR